MTVDEGIDITVNKDRGVLKRIIKEGEGTNTPHKGSEVTVHYTGTLLDGSKFDSSKDRNEPFSFTLGKGRVIRGWDIGVATMKKGEVCVLTCAPEYAYGANGSPPKIPPNSTLQFEVEMIDWELDDLSPGKTKDILRENIEAGEAGSESPKTDAVVTVELEGRLQDGKVFDNRTVTFTLGEGSEANICEGIEKALLKFTKGEKSKLIIQPKFAFKSDGDSKLGVSSDAIVEYVVKLVSFENAKEAWSMEPEEKLEQARIAKDRGTEFFKAGKYELAINKYKRVVNLIKDENSEEQPEIKDLLLKAYLNLALVYSKVDPPQLYHAVTNASNALELDPNNVKGLFRRGQALLQKGDAGEAMADFQKVVEIEPGNKAAANHIIMCRNAIRNQQQLEKQLYRNMFEKFANVDKQMEKLRAQEQVDVIGEKVGEWGKGEGEWTDEQRDRKPTEFEKENPNILLLDKDGRFENM
ncbi:FK506-binding protein 59 [Leptidea sinapis]|uniref:FK506-binding protein 59 n=1 Tax=Leptidea sinapis TaxID=189913 RepID=UPI0021227057|nr:FK506-binding protein 59 [Leptidea sinapis]